MGWSFRKKIKVAPGIHLNISKSGVSTSVGPKGAKINVGPKGTTLYTSIPGTGIYYRGKVSGTKDLESTKIEEKKTSPTTRILESCYQENNGLVRTLENIKESSTKPKPFLNSWIIQDGDGSITYGCLGNWRRFFIWIGIIVLSVFLIYGIVNVELEWWKLTLYSFIIIGALLFLWYINGGVIKQKDARKRLFRILWLSFSVALVATCHTLVDMPGESENVDNITVETTEMAEIASDEGIVQGVIQSDSQDEDNDEEEISRANYERERLYSDLLTGCLVSLSFIILLIIISYVRYYRVLSDTNRIQGSEGRST